MLAFSSLRHYWRLNLCLGAGVFLASAVLTGSLVVGDSVRETLRRAGELRIGNVDVAVIGGDRFFTEGLALANGAAPVLWAEGAVTNAGSETRANQVQILGVADAFWALAPDGGMRDFGPGSAGISESLARQLEVKAGDMILARMEQPSAISKDAPLSGSADSTVAIRKRVTHIVPDAQFGRFGLKAEQEAPMNLFLPLAFLQEKLERGGKVNLMLAGGGQSAEALVAKLDAAWTMEDAELKLRDLKEVGWEISSERIFVSEAEEAAIRHVQGGVTGALTYLVNGISANGKTVPYSMVSAADDGDLAAFGDRLAEGEAVINEWLASAETGLGVKAGDKIKLTYFVMSDGRKMEEESADFVVARVVPMTHPQMNKSWMPDFPGVSEAGSCRDWDPGFAIDQDRIRDEDEKYWEKYKGTPKAFIRLGDGQEIWRNRFGRLTSLRFADADFQKAGFEEKLRGEIDFEALGFAVRAVGSEAREAVAKSLDFGALFAGLSFFLILAALILVALLFVFGLEQRSAQAGVLLAMGFRAASVRRMFLSEAGVIALTASLLGALGGVLYTRIALWGLNGVWRDAVARLDFAYHSRPMSVVAGVLIVFVMSMLTVWFVSRRIEKVPPKDLVAGQGFEPPVKEKAVRRGAAFWCVVGGLAAGAGMLAAAKGKQGEMLAGLFYGAGMMLMIAGLGAVALLLRRWSHGQEAENLTDLSRRNATRRRGRSLAVAAVMACGVFMVTAVNSFRLQSADDPTLRASGAGGFRFVGNSTLPIYDDLNSAEGRKVLGLDDIPAEDLKVVAFRMQAAGEEASCLNLNSVAQPRLMGVDASALAEREAFVFAGTEGEFEKSAWELLDAELEDGVIPAIADKASAMWAMHKKLGDDLVYADGAGVERRVRLVGFLANSTLQGSVIISESNFKAMFPDAGGYRFFLMETEKKAAGELTRMLEDRGLALTASMDRLAAYSEVQNTYLTIFSTLGGLGVLLGTVGAGLVIGRNVMERRGELAVMRAMGFERSKLRAMVLKEHWFLIVAGVAVGALSALLAVLPNLTAQGSGGLPVMLLLVLLVAVLLAGFVFCRMAARWAMRGELMEGLRSE